MSVSSKITDGTGTKRQALVDDQHALLVSVSPCPSILTQKNKVYRAYLQTAAASNDMGISGAVTSVPFYVSAHDTDDRYITAVNFYVGYGASANLFEWVDSGAALGNGHRFYYTRSTEEIDIHDAIQVNSDLLRLCVKDLLPTTWEARNFAALNDYGFVCTVNLIAMMPPYGLKLDRGTSQRLIFEVRDDNTDADVMNAIAYGFDRFE